MVCRIVNDTSPLPPVSASPEEDDGLFDDYPWVEGPVTKIDYGYNIKYEAYILHQHCL